ncbi:MAG: hypothetical protein QXI60_00795 [Thermofilaceae archaeon]
MISRRGLGSALPVILFLSTLSVSPAAQENVLRTIRGKYLYRTLKERRERGTEDWVLTRQVDGSRTLRAMVQITDTGVLRDVILTVDESFRPKEAYMRLWVKGKFIGSAVYFVEGNRLEAIVLTPENGRLTQQLSVPGHFSFVGHPVAGDGWHFWYYDLARGGEQEITVYNPETLGGGSGAILGVIQKFKAKFLGEEEVSVPAGKFFARHYELGGMFHIWVSGEDHVLVRMTLPQANLEYVLIEYKPNGS